MRRRGNMNYHSKYYNVKTKTTDGLVFDSMKEARRWEQLLLLQKAGEITSLRRQVSYELIPAQYETCERYSDKTGKRLKDEERLIERKCEYIADFVYTDSKTGETVVEDVKSAATKTEAFAIKKKLMLVVHGIKIRIVGIV
jgi:hypothetical protein